ncbi:MAG: cytochrome c [Deltaproteobacteria bacterium]|nr:cytochrome c [Deltaproteobacteria bacterium]
MRDSIGGFLSMSRAALAAAFFLSGALYGCSGEKGQVAATAGKEAAQAAQTTGRPAAPDLMKGKEIYEQYCHFCHGYKGYGDGPVGIALSPHPANFVEDSKRMAKTDEELFKSITEGIHRDIGGEAMSMPRWQEVLTDHERWNVLWYIRHLGEEGRKASGQKP